MHKGYAEAVSRAPILALCEPFRILSTLEASIADSFYVAETQPTGRRYQTEKQQNSSSSQQSSRHWNILQHEDI